MGKKTLEEIGKILLVSMISILISTMATRRIALDKKMDRAEYNEDQNQRWTAHDKIEKEKDKRLEDMYQMVKDIYYKEFNKDYKNKEGK